MFELDRIVYTGDKDDVLPSGKDEQSFKSDFSLVSVAGTSALQLTMAEPCYKLAENAVSSPRSVQCFCKNVITVITVYICLFVNCVVNLL